MLSDDAACHTGIISSEGDHLTMLRAVLLPLRLVGPSDIGCGP